MATVRTLLLNADGTFHEMHNRFRAIALAQTNRVTILDWWDDEHAVHSGNDIFIVPALMIYHKYINVRKFYKRPALTRDNLFRRDKYTCQYCGKLFADRQLTFEHIIPQHRGGPTTWMNIVAACKKCNNKKGHRTPEEAGMPLLCTPYVPKVDEFMGLSKRKISGKIHESWTPYIDDS